MEAVVAYMCFCKYRLRPFLKILPLLLAHKSNRIILSD